MRMFLAKGTVDGVFPRPCGLLGERDEKPSERGATLLAFDELFQRSVILRTPASDGYSRAFHVIPPAYVRQMPYFTKNWCPDKTLRLWRIYANVARALCL